MSAGGYPTGYRRLKAGWGYPAEDAWRCGNAALFAAVPVEGRAPRQSPSPAKDRPERIWQWEQIIVPVVGFVRREPVAVLLRVGRSLPEVQHRRGASPSGANR